MNKFPDISALMMFIALVESKSFKVAAQKCSVTPSSVSQAIKVLEDIYQTQLIDRTSRPISITVAGRNFYTSALQSIRAIKALEKSVLNGSDYYPSLRLGVSESVSATVLPWLLPILKNKVRTITVDTAMTHILSEGFLRDQFDIFIGPIAFLDAENIYRRSVIKESFLVMCPPDTTPLTSKKELHGLTKSLPYLSYNSGSWDQQLTMRLLRTLSISPSEELKVESSSTLLSLIAQGEGWTLMPPSNLLLGSLFAKKIKIYALNDLELVRHQYVLTQSESFQPLVDQIATDYVQIVKNKIYPILHRINPLLPLHIQPKNK